MIHYFSILGNITGFTRTTISHYLEILSNNGSETYKTMKKIVLLIYITNLKVYFMNYYFVAKKEQKQKKIK